MISKKVFRRLTTKSCDYVINDMMFLRSHRDLSFKDKFHVNLFIVSGFKYDSALCNVFSVSTDSLESMEKSIKDSIEEYGKALTDLLKNHYQRKHDGFFTEA